MAELSAAIACDFENDAEVDDKVGQLKLLCGLLKSPVDRQRCLEAILSLRSQQHAAAMSRAKAEL
jgi:hypothetical protein